MFKTISLFVLNIQRGKIFDFPGLLNLRSGFEHWIMKFDGVGNHGVRELGDHMGYGKIEYTYYLIASASGRYHNRYFPEPVYGTLI